MADSDSGKNTLVVGEANVPDKPVVQVLASPEVLDVRPSPKLPRALPDQLMQEIHTAEKRSRIMIRSREWVDLANEYLAVSNPKCLEVIHHPGLGHTCVAWGR